MAIIATIEDLIIAIADRRSFDQTERRPSRSENQRNGPEFLINGDQCDYSGRIYPIGTLGKKHTRDPGIQQREEG